ncbi:aminotransferase class IV [Ureibacillus manganicus]|uniref:4-amino-4-deoxychorismate lyase n=1 Tax=Ureibacillus manganicus DSM 26584 TaxID=1384049 RepID=A0A0A3HT86_9BACL|nr:aminotransferase class IV [Ureibacillus manganicus]KGR73503.1 hypothetical protein CD29_19980 [Ureibacillus manganicus DSM 26584]
MILWMNGNYISEDDAAISPFDHGYLYGLSFFEKFRTYKGQVVLFQEHYHRLITKLNQFHIEMPYSVPEILRVIKDLTKKANNQDGLFYLTVSAGNNNLQMQFQSSYKEPNVCIIRREIFPGERGREKSAKWLEMKGTYTLHENRYLGSLEIEQLDNTEGFFLSQRGIITEGITSNVFFAKDGVLYTPSIATGITPGITRQWVINTAKQIGYRVVEDLFIRQDLEDAYECFVTNSIEELVPISNIDNIHFLGKDGTIYQRLHQAYIDEILRTVKKGE